MLKQCMGRGNKKPKYLFNPRITKEWREGGTLVVGINHWCIQSGCEHYEDCVLNSNSKEYDKLCEWAVSEVDEKTKYDLRYTTYEAFSCYFGDFLGYESFKEFLLYITGTQDCMEPDEQRKYWNRLAFYNYIQHFTKMSLTHTSLYGVKEALSKKEDEDFAAFLDVLHDLKPRLVIVWHKDIKELLLRKIADGKVPSGRNLQLVDDLGIPTKSMFRFVYQEKNTKKEDVEIDRIIVGLKKDFEDVKGFSTEQVVLRLLRWNMFKTEDDLALLTQLPVSGDTLKKMLESTERYAWDSTVLIYLVKRIQDQMKITSVLDKIPYAILHYSEDSVVFSNVLLPANKNIRACPMLGVYPEDCAHYSLKRYEEKDLLSLAGLSFDGLRSKTYIDETEQAQGFIVYIDENHPLSEAFFKHLFEAKLDKKGYSMLIMKSSQVNDNRYLQILKESNRLHTIRSQFVEGASYLFIKLHNVAVSKVQVQLEDKDHKIYNTRLKSLIPVEHHNNYSGKIVLEKKITETDSQRKGIKKQISKLIEAKNPCDDALNQRLITVIYNGHSCGLLLIGANGIEFNSAFGRKACYRLFCYKIYKTILKDYGADRVAIIEKLFNFKNVANTKKKLEVELEEKNLGYNVKAIKLCINCQRTEDFEAKFKNLKNACYLNI